MLNIIASRAEKINPVFTQAMRQGNEDNVKWLQRHFKTLVKEKDVAGLTYIALLGGTQKAYFRTRVAQSHLRNDMSPSHWSHAVLFQGSNPTKKGALWEISLEPSGGFGYPPSDNGVQEGYLSDYASKNQFPNIALIRLPIKLHRIKEVMKRFKTQRVEIDCVELTLLWLGYVWGVGRAVNPLIDGYGMPSAVFIETLCSTGGFDLTPGLESRASCPEAIWQAARWWHEFHVAEQRSAPLRGMWHTEHYLGV